MSNPTDPATGPHLSERAHARADDVHAADDDRFTEPGAVAEPHAPLDGLLVERVEAWIADDVDDVDRDELRGLLELARSTPDDLRATVRANTARAELVDRFAATLQFGTAGLRGEMAAGPNRMNRAVVRRAAAGLGGYLSQVLPAEAARVVVGYDARHRSRDFAIDTAGVLTAAGHDALVLPGPLPTPVLAFAVRHLRADAGVMVTASHNPPADNGYKVYLGGRVVEGSGQGAQIVPPFDAEIAAQIAAIGPVSEIPVATDGWTTLGDDLLRAYLDAVHRLWDGSDDRTLRIATTPLHGVGGPVLARVLAEAHFPDVAVVDEQAAADPDFPTVDFPNPEEKGAIDLALALAQDWGADLVIANDPDADRCAVAVYDPRGGSYRGKETAQAQGWRMLHGDEVGALLGEEAARRAEGTGGVLASSVVSSRLLGRVAAAHGLRHATTLTGFKWIARTEDLVFGYEEALGYCVDPESVRDKDGLSAALVIAQLAQRLKAEGSSLVAELDAIARRYGLYLTDQVSARFEDLSEIDDTMVRLRETPPATVAGAAVTSTADLADGYEGLPPTDGVLWLCADSTRVIVRPSGTEPKVKAYLEVVVPVGEDDDDEQVARARWVARQRLDDVAKDVRAALGLS
ncbi:phosphomannomutase [Luteimicrobium album]|uniref:Phosphomannomutase n=1 Tax=Luteimicrobium album TaxID=1054550 RepID=A0ABQ6HXC2_9MICO|nr:phospho-sugar mutase [Luteimicrobium album]GMA22349.1 phosphomannomutase [Luteimicrobium album]